MAANIQIVTNYLIRSWQFRDKIFVLTSERLLLTVALEVLQTLCRWVKQLGSQ
jgi:hypothetical protein